MFDGNFSNVLVASERFRRDGPRQLWENQLEGVLELVIDHFGVSLLMVLSHGADVTI